MSKFKELYNNILKNDCHHSYDMTMLIELYEYYKQFPEGEEVFRCVVNGIVNNIIERKYE